MVVANIKRASLEANIKEHVEQGASVYTDKLCSYNHLGGDYVHNVIDHGVLLDSIYAAFYSKDR